MLENISVVLTRLLKIVDRLLVKSCSIIYVLTNNIPDHTRSPFSLVVEHSFGKQKVVCSMHTWGISFSINANITVIGCIGGEMNLN